MHAVYKEIPDVFHTKLTLISRSIRATSTLYTVA